MISEEVISSALKEIERIKSEKVWQKGEPKTYYTELTDTLRTYIKDRFDFFHRSLMWRQLRFYFYLADNRFIITDTNDQID